MNLADPSFGERRDSPRIMTRVFVRGLGADRAWVDCLGDIAVGGVGIQYPNAPEAERFQVGFYCPGEQQMRSAVAEVIDYVPLSGPGDSLGPCFVHLKFSKIAFEDQRALARSIDEQISMDLPAVSNA